MDVTDEYEKPLVLLILDAAAPLGLTDDTVWPTRVVRVPRVDATATTDEVRAWSVIMETQVGLMVSADDGCVEKQATDALLLAVAHDVGRRAAASGSGASGSGASGSGASDTVRLAVPVLPPSAAAALDRVLEVCRERVVERLGEDEADTTEALLRRIVAKGMRVTRNTVRGAA